VHNCEALFCFILYTFEQKCFVFVLVVLKSLGAVLKNE